MCLFKKKKKTSESKSNREAGVKAAKKFMHFDNFEDFKKAFIFYNKQDLALEDGASYIDVTTSNMDGNIFGEQFDNAIRLKFIEESNPEFMAQIDKDALLAEARRQYEEDKMKVENGTDETGDN